MRVLVTRAEPAASRTAEYLQENSHEAVCFPLFELRDTGMEIPPETPDGYIFTSANACEILKLRGWTPPSPETPAFCVGRRTAEAANALGFVSVFHAEGGGETLAPLIAQHYPTASVTLLYFTTHDRSYDMVGALAKDGITVKHAEIYQVAERHLEPGSLMKVIEKNMPHAIFTYSRRSSHVLARQIMLEKLEERLNSMTLVAISENAASPLHGFPWNETLVTPVANEEAMLHILGRCRAAGQAGP